MLKLNNRGFAISTMLYGMMALIVILLYVLFSNTKSNAININEMSERIENDLEVCQNEKKTYENSKSNEDWEYYKSCYCKKVYRDNTSCDIKYPDNIINIIEE